MDNSRDIQSAEACNSIVVDNARMIQKIFEVNKQTSYRQAFAKHQSMPRNLVFAINTRISSGPDSFISLLNIVNRM